MKALVIYDATGRIWNIIYGEETLPPGMLAMFVDIPEGAVLERIDVRDPQNPVAVFGEYPETDYGQMKKDIKQAQSDIIKINETLASNTYTNKAVQLMAMSFDDASAVAVKDVYPLWSALEDGTQLTKQEEAVNGTEITKVRGNEGLLYKVITSHKKQADWIPGQGTESLFEVIEETHSGSIDDPIPYNVNMVVYEGKYYEYAGTLYVCIRNSEIALQYTPDQLIDQYFRVADES